MLKDEYKTGESLIFRKPTEEQIQKVLKEKPYLNEAWTLDVRDLEEEKEKVNVER